MRHPAQEPDVLPGRTLAGVGLGVIVATGLGVMFALLLGRCRSHELGHAWVPPLARPEITGEIDTMETRPFSVEAQGLEATRLAERHLHSYGWIDRDRQIVHLPIDVAIELYLANQPGDGR